MSRGRSSSRSPRSEVPDRSALSSSWVTGDALPPSTRIRYKPSSRGLPRATIAPSCHPVTGTSTLGPLAQVDHRAAHVGGEQLLAGDPELTRVPGLHHVRRIHADLPDTQPGPGAPVDHHVLSDEHRLVSRGQRSVRLRERHRGTGRELRGHPGHRAVSAYVHLPRGSLLVSTLAPSRADGR